MVLKGLGVRLPLVASTFCTCGILSFSSTLEYWSLLLAYWSLLIWSLVISLRAEYFWGLQLETMLSLLPEPFLDTEPCDPMSLCCCSSSTDWKLTLLWFWEAIQYEHILVWILA